MHCHGQERWRHGGKLALEEGSLAASLILASTDWLTSPNPCLVCAWDHVVLSNYLTLQILLPPLRAHIPKTTYAAWVLRAG